MKTRVLCLLIVGAASALAGNTGTIKGIVVNEHGKPVQQAKVHIAEMKSFFGHRILKFYETDRKGRFVIENVEWGTYVVLAGKESAGYPDTKLAFYSNLDAPTVTLAPGFPISDVRVQLSPKAGMLEVTSVSDALTGKPIESASITLRRIGTPFLITTSTVRARILVPSMTDVSVEIHAPGYKSWPQGTQDNGQIRLRPEQVFKLQAQLQPDNSVAR